MFLHVLHDLHGSILLPNLQQFSKFLATIGLIAGGKLYVWDWEDAGAWVEGKDEAWFKKQVYKLLGIEA